MTYIVWTQDTNWTYIRGLDDVQDVFWTCCEHSINVLCPGIICTWVAISLASSLRLWWTSFVFTETKKKDSNPVHADVSFSYPLKTSESLWFYGVSKRYRNWTLEWNELRGKTMKPFLSVSEEWLLEASEVRVIFHSQ